MLCAEKNQIPSKTLNTLKPLEHKAQNIAKKQEQVPAKSLKTLNTIKKPIQP